MSMAHVIDIHTATQLVLVHQCLVSCRLQWRPPRPGSIISAMSSQRSNLYDAFVLTPINCPNPDHHRCPLRRVEQSPGCSL